MKLHGTQKRRSLHWTMCVWDGRGMKKVVGASILDLGEVIEE